MNQKLKHPIAIIGAGPVGLAAAAHLHARGQTPLILEAGSQIAHSIREWAHVPMFSNWRSNIDKAAVAILEANDWQPPDLNTLPTGGELIDRYLIPLANTPQLKPLIHLQTRVTAISRNGIDKMKDRGRENAPFIIYTDTPKGEQTFLARAIIDASGTWQTPNPAGSSGLPAPGERHLNGQLAYGIPDVLGSQRARYAGKRIAVVGAGHSAINVLLELGDLAEESPDTRITWILRKKNVAETYGGLEGDALPGRGLLGVRMKGLVESGIIEIVTPFYINRFAPVDGAVQITGDTPKGARNILVDQVIAATGARPNLHILRELRLDMDVAVESPATLAPLIDPNIHSCGTVRPHGEKELRHPEKDFYIVGMKSYGRAPTFLLATGYEQVRSVVAGLVGDWDAARKVELVLPETGVCGIEAAANDCCGPAVTAKLLQVGAAVGRAKEACC